MKNLGNMLKEAQKLQTRMAEMQQQLAEAEMTGTAGGGMVRVEADGKGNVREVKIDPSVVNADDVAMLEDLVTVALRDAQQKARALEESEMGKATGGMDMPFQLPF